MKEFTDKVASSKSNDFDLKLLKLMIQALWERSYKKVLGREYSPCAVMFVDANSTPEKIAPFLGGPTASKVGHEYMEFLCIDLCKDFQVK